MGLRPPFFPSAIMPSVFKRIPKPAVSEDVAVTHDNLVPVNNMPVPRKPYGFQEAVVGHHGLVYTPSGVYSHQGPQSSPAGMRNDEKVDYIPLPKEVVLEEDNDADVDDVDDEAAKKQRQWRKWSEDVIPALIKPYLGVLQESDGLREMNKIRSDKDACKGCGEGRLLEVSCIFFESKLYSFKLYNEAYYLNNRN